MRKGSDLIGKPVVSFDTGEQFEKIHDVVFDQQNNQLLGFVVDEGGWFSTSRVLPLSGVQAIGPDAVIVPNKKVIISSDSDQRFRSILARNNILKGTKIVTTDGRDLGTLTDLYFDEHNGTVEGYEASGGLFADSYTGRSFIPAPQTLKIGEDVAFVPPETADLMEEQVGGVKAALQEASATVSEKAGDAQDAAAGQTIDQAKGRRVSRAVRTGEGLMIAAPGQIVTEQVINRARTYHVENDLLDATGLTVTQAAGNTVQATGQQAADSLKQGAENVKQGATGLWEKLKETVSGAQDQAAEKLEEQRINAALGRPTDRVILDPQDNVILNAGELITHQAVKMARAGGVLDILLSSVADVRAEIPPENLKADHAGEASLDAQEHSQPGTSAA
ncbi:MAG: PRC-barrel domain-containing protein [Herpetosiphonaceae bacterium]|nr:PRC-barrel domain-containing protein [Herpetosiphonaceae bacterium]